MEKIHGNLLDITNGIIIHGCNCKGSMGAGIALQIRRKWPDVYTNYKDFCLEYPTLGDIQVLISDERDAQEYPYISSLYKVVNPFFTVGLNENLIIINAFTQYKPGPNADIDAIFAAFAKIRLVARATGMPVYFPLIGCGIGGLDWKDVEPVIDQALGSNITSTLIIYEKEL